MKKQLTAQEEKIYAKAKSVLTKNPILRGQSSACRNAWCEGFVNAFLYFQHKENYKNSKKRRWYFLWLK